MSRRDEKITKNYLSTVSRIKPKSAAEWLALQHMTASSRAVYNMGLYTTRQHYYQTQSYLPYEGVYKVVKQVYPDYKTLHSQAAQQTLKKVHQDMMSFFENKKSAKEDGRKVCLPRYKDKNSLFNVYLAKDCFKICGEQVRISLSKACQKVCGLRFLYLPLPKSLQGLKIQELQIIPQFKGSFFSVGFCYLDPKQLEQVCKEGVRFLGIDLGVRHLASVIDTVNSVPYLISGEKIKSINQWYNKRISSLKSILEKENKKETSRQIQMISRRRQEQLANYFHKLSAGIVRYCVEQGIYEIHIGMNKGWKQEVGLGRKNNQEFVQIPHSQLVSKIRYRAEKHGICVVEREESYTSKCDALGLEEIKKQASYMGRRVKRGLFRSAVGKVLQADVNGAINILRKSKGELLEPWVRAIACSCRVYRPRKLRFAGSGSFVLGEPQLARAG